MVDMEPLSMRRQKASMWSPASTPSSSASQQQQWGESSGSSNRGGSVLFIASHQDDLEDTAHFKPSNSKLPHRKLPVKKRNKAHKERWLLRHAIGCWPVLLALIVVPLLILEVCNLSQHNPTLPRRLGESGELQLFPENLTERKESNLDNLDMPMRTIAGVREPCLKLLSAAEISNLDFPPPSVSQIKSLSYKKTRPFLDNSGNSSANRGLLFTGNQTMEEREQSFQVTESMEVHCGFCGNEDIFHIEKQDRSFLLGCKAVVTTCNFGGGDDLFQPINMTQASLSKVCYVAFWDKITLEAQALKGRAPDNDRKIGHWRIVVVENLPFNDQRLNGKIPKMLGHRLFVNAKYSIWVDSKSQFRRDPMGVFEAILWRANLTFAISQHGARDNVYDEGAAIVKKHKATPEEVSIQLTQYRNEGFPEKSRFDGHKALAEASVIIREHTPLTNLLMCLWFNEATRFTARDQLSFPYVLKRLDLLHINMFPVCTRKALVNSMGHVRKAKPIDMDTAA
ncbi:hypothetical protein GOP47_0010045 [Adiantum capillus-veneris]|uniref:TOD1/MUCI70 glycosyltransferase-like domain-containing protein n=1 Tax=Adiantum capillus-veneris TaxID=13818 RepID=A0A9D4UUJ1_ADICA|nr:hypothetical protein GOP47_0010045 [Adiantum capillus-veneris]